MEGPGIGKMSPEGGINNRKNSLSKSPPADGNDKIVRTFYEIDKEDQENELMVLESILDKDGEFIHDNELGLCSGQIKIEIELPKKFVVTTNSAAGMRKVCILDKMDKDKMDPFDQSFYTVIREVPVPVPVPVQGVTSSSSPEEIGVGEVSHLPPITLLFTLPNNYPSEEGPTYTLQSNWLDRGSLSLLCEALDDIWAKNKGTVVLFSWITFIREEALKAVGIDKMYEVSLHPKRQKAISTSTCDKAASATSEDKPSSSSSARRIMHSNSKKELDSRAVFLSGGLKDKDLLFTYLMDFDREREEIKFKESYHSCQVCFVNKSGEDFLKLDKCGHYFCKECLTGCYSTHIKEGGIDAVKCLAVSCGSTPTSAQVHSLVGPVLFERYDGILLQRALEGMSDLTYCPRTQCGKPVIIEQDEKLAWCSHCSYRFCSICKMVFHGVEPCRFKSDEKMKLFAEYTGAKTKEERQALEKTYGKKQLAILVESTLSEKYIEKESKPCPHCKVPIEKYEGCNKVTCTKCGAYFCWMCSKQLDKGNPYFHFQDQFSPCYNRLFENELQIEFEDGDDEQGNWSDDELLSFSEDEDEEEEDDTAS